MIIPLNKHRKATSPIAAAFALGLFLGGAVVAISLVNNTHVAPNFTVQRIVSVYDGDTFRVDFACGEPLVCSSVPIRVRGVDTPEIRAQCPLEREKAIAARDFARSVLTGGTVTLSDLERGKYFRIVADVEVGGRNLARELIDAGYGRAYHGGKREGWCVD